MSLVNIEAPTELLGEVHDFIEKSGIGTRFFSGMLCLGVFLYLAAPFIQAIARLKEVSSANEKKLARLKKIAGQKLERQQLEKRAKRGQNKMAGRKSGRNKSGKR